MNTPTPPLPEKEKAQAAADQNAANKAGKNADPSLLREHDELKTLLKRLQADFENHVKRVERERAELYEFANAKLILKLLTFKDDFERALAAHESPEKLLEGVRMIKQEFDKLLADEGVTTINATGQHVDPYKHEVLMTTDTADGEDGVVLEELQKGYEFRGKVIRPARVRVAKNKKTKEETKEEQPATKTKTKSGLERSETHNVSMA